MNSDKKEKQFNQWWSEVELENQSAGGHVTSTEKELAHDAWEVAFSKPQNLRLICAALIGVTIGFLIANRVRKED